MKGTVVLVASFDVLKRTILLCWRLLCSRSMNFTLLRTRLSFICTRFLAVFFRRRFARGGVHFDWLCLILRYVLSIVKILHLFRSCTFPKSVPLLGAGIIESLFHLSQLLRKIISEQNLPIQKPMFSYPQCRKSNLPSSPL